MTNPGSPLQDALRRRRRQEHEDACVEVLKGIGLQAARTDFLSFDAAEDLFERYLHRLSEIDEQSRWRSGDRSAADGYLGRIADFIGDTNAIWLALATNEPAAMKVPAAPLLRSASTYLVTRAGDLMLVSADTNDGICVELNYSATGDEYEISAWGVYDS